MVVMVLVKVSQDQNPLQVETKKWGKGEEKAIRENGQGMRMGLKRRGNWQSPH
jgi:hypothetical protein